MIQPAKIPSFLILIASIVTFQNFAVADILEGNTEITFANPSSTPVSLDLSIDTDADTVDITISGLATGWFGVGFGSTTMFGTYGIVAHQDGTVEERSLNYSGGSVITSSINVVSNTVDGSIRTLELQRDIDAGPGYYTFPTTPGNISLISASNSGAYGFHGNMNRNPGSINLVAIPEPSALSMFAGIVVLSARRRSRIKN